MTPRRLRLRVFTILGLAGVSCTKQAQSTGDSATGDGATGNSEPTVLVIPPIASASSSAVVEDELDQELFTHPAARAFDCGPNRTRSLVCGRAYGDPEKPAERPYHRCDQTARSVSHEVSVGRHPTPARFDSALTARYRQHKTGSGDWCCYSQCTDVKVVAAAAPLPKGFRSRLSCITSMQRGTKFPADGRSDCPAAIDFGGGPDRTYAAPFSEESSKLRTQWARERTGFEDLSLCCYQDATRFRPHIRRGRALRDATGRLIVARSEPSRSWAEAACLEVEPDLGVADRWLRDAELEHASVASFAQLALELMACGAPPKLIADAHESALDEIRHAQICYAFASSYAGGARGPGPLTLPPPPRGDVVSLAIATFRDGCVGETAAALVAARSADGCELEIVRNALTTIAVDEERHALLAWRILQWTLGFDGVAPALTRECDTLVRATGPRLACADTTDPLAAHGLLSAETEEQIRHEVVTEVVLPCARALLGA